MISARRERVDEEQNGAERDVDYLYDALGRLTQEVSSGDDSDWDYTLDWVYDLVGNRIEQTRTPTGGSAVTTTYQYNDRDPLEQETTAGVTKSYEYDDNGALDGVDLTGDGSIDVDYTYNLRGRLASEVESGVTTSFVYDHAGRRVSRTSAGTTTTYVLDGLNPTGYDQVLEELAVSASETSRTGYTLGHC